MPTYSIKKAVDLAKAGQKKEAREILLHILREKPDNEAAFFWYVDTLDTRFEREKALEAFLARHPGHPQASAALGMLRKQAGATYTIEEQPAPSAEPEAPAVVEVEQPQPEPQPPQAAAPQVLPPYPAQDARPRVDRATQPRRKTAEAPARRAGGPNVLKTTIIILALLVVCVAVAVPVILNNPAFMSPQKNYARQMEPVVVRLDKLMNGPVVKWGNIMDTTVYEGKTVTYRDVLYYNMKLGISDVFVARELSPIVGDINLRSHEIINVIKGITPPPEVSEPHERIVACIQFELDWSQAILDFLNRSQTQELPPNPCGGFNADYTVIKDFVEKNK